VDAVTQTANWRTEWQARLGLIGRRGDGHGVNPETDYSRIRLWRLCFSTAFPQLWKYLARAFLLSSARAGLAAAYNEDF